MRVADGKMSKKRTEDQVQASLGLCYATQRATKDILTMGVLSVGFDEISKVSVRKYSKKLASHSSTHPPDSRLI